MTYRLKNVKTGEVGRTTYASFFMAHAAVTNDQIVIDQYGQIVHKHRVTLRRFINDDFSRLIQRIKS
jgi:hypothetical protein